MATLESLEKDLARIVAEKDEALAERRQLRDDLEAEEIARDAWLERDGALHRRVRALGLMTTVLMLQIEAAKKGRGTSSR